MSTQNFITTLCSTLFENIFFSNEEGFMINARGDRLLRLQMLCDVIDGDRRLTVREVADKCVISKTKVHEILVQELHMKFYEKL
jgi:hypothetical protein